MHLDGAISKEEYLAKVEEYKKRQREITAEMDAHIAGDESCLITIQSLFAFAKRTKELFASSNMDEKRQLLKFVFSNLKLDGENLHLELLEPFSSIAKSKDQPVWLEQLVTLRNSLAQTTVNWKSLKNKLDYLYIRMVNANKASPAIIH